MKVRNVKKLIAAIIVLPALWAGYWCLGSYGLKSDINGWLTERRSDGWQVEYSDLRVRGFPNRFDTTIQDVQLTDPDSGISWTAPFFQTLSLSYKPNHVIAVWPDSHSLATPFQKLDISSDETKASLVLNPDPALSLQRATLVSQDLSIASSADWLVDIGSVSSSIRNLDTPETYEMSTIINDVLPSKSLREWLEVNPNLPNTIESISLELVSELSKQVDKTMIEHSRPQLRHLSISQAQVIWGELVLRSKGELNADENGVIDGELAVSAKNWREMLKLLVSAEILTVETANAAEFGLGLIARLSGSDETLDAPLRFSSGTMFLGPIPVGKAPVLIIR